MDDFAIEMAARDAELDRLHKSYTVGRAVTCNGFPGVVVQTYSGEMRGMINVRLRSGVVCVSLIELDKEQTAVRRIVTCTAQTAIRKARKGVDRSAQRA